MLDEYGGDLTGPEALDEVHRRGVENELDVAARHAHAILRLAAVKGSDRFLDGVLDGLGDPIRISETLSVTDGVVSQGDPGGFPGPVGG